MNYDVTNCPRCDGFFRKEGRFFVCSTNCISIFPNDDDWNIKVVFPEDVRLWWTCSNNTVEILGMPQIAMDRIFLSQKPNTFPEAIEFITMTYKQYVDSMLFL